MFKQAVEQIIKDNEKMIIVSAEVSEVKGDSFDAKVSGKADLLNVRLNSVLTEVKNKFVVVPKVGSTVLCGVIENNKSTAVLLQCSEVDFINVSIESNTLRIDEKGVVYNGGSLGGLVVSEKVANEVNILKQELNSLKQIFTGWTPVPSDGGAVLKTAVTAWAGKVIEPTVKKTLENDKIKH